MPERLLANALVQIRGFEIDLFESAPAFTERGAAVGISSKAKEALQELVPSASELLRKAGGSQTTRLVLSWSVTSFRYLPYDYNMPSLDCDSWDGDSLD